ncbi:putative disease resistance protein RGA4 [Salvia hispanica]|uniref:putative disease resistance protein RGA4 n=1 Tax=Salvia hispanica TaxID=49212 RepID=UPI002009812E|nr:putative disease resistance protein RGA4 [Salvia hispanica]
MEGEAAAAVLQVLVQNLIDHSKKEFSLVRGLEKEAKKLSESLDTIQKYLNDAEMSTNPGDAVKSWLKKLENVAFDADNVLDEFNYHLLCKQIKPIMPNKPMKQKVLSCFSPCLNYSRSRSMALRIQEINENLEVINKEAADLGLKEMLATNVPTLPDVSRETDSFTLDPNFIGRVKVTSEIVERVTSCITTDERVSILAIVGMGGLGKTTLTRKVFHLLKQKNLFGSYIWVHVSQIFDPIVLLKKILKELISSDQVEVESRQDILKKIQEALNDKSYLLILDDVWNEDRPTWDGFINSLLGVSSIKGNVIVVTTRSMVVASTVSALYTHKLEGLSKDDCWSIIKAKTFGKEDVPSLFEPIGTEIAKKCQGLPLAANVVGGVLHNKSEEEWRSIKDNWISQDEGDHIRKILKLSFDNLSLPSLKKCFAYCSIFPKGHRIERKKLIEYWMAEGFLVANRSSDMESMGDKFITVLIHNSLLQIAKRDDYDGNVESCVMHDLVHDLAYSILGGPQDASDIFPVRYMFLEKKSKHVFKKNAKYLRTLLSMDNSYANMLSEFKCLHVLIIFGSDRDIELPSSIMKLIHLRVLNINGSRIRRLPDWIGKLVHLQTLRAEKVHLLKLPSTLKYLINLRHLYVKKNVDLPAEMGLLTSLRTLDYFSVGDKSGYKVEELGSLNDLNGKLEISKLEKVGNKEEAEKANLHKKSKLLELHLVWNHQYGGQISEKESESECRNDENVMEGLQPHSNLKKLEIYGFKGKRFPTWTAVENAAQGSWIPLNKLIEVKLSQCSECEEIPMLGQLPNLKSLSLVGLSNVKSIKSYAHESQCIGFPALESLQIYDMPKLTEWVHTESVDVSGVKLFPRLQHLAIQFCKQLTNFPALYLSPLNHLTISGIGSYRPLANIFETQLMLLTQLCVKRIDDLECLPDWLFESNPNLSVLEIKECPNLRGLPDGLCNISSLEKLIIKKCQNLEHMGVQQSEGSLACLKELDIKDCNALVYVPCELLGFSLEKLRLENLSSLQNVAEIIDCLPKLARLTSLRMLGVPQFSADNYIGIRRLKLDFSVMGSMETVDGILQGCSFTIDGLELKGREGWESLPKSIQTLTALEKLKLENFGMEELPDWLGNFSSLLRVLEISNCNKLRRLPMDVIRCFAKLKYLIISNCPQKPLHVYFLTSISQCNTRASL